MKKIISLLLILMLLATGCSPTQEDPPTPTPDPTPVEPQPDEGDKALTAEQLLAKMSLEEKVGQLFLIRPESLDASLTQEQVHSTRDYGTQQLTEEMAALLKQYPAGGIAIFGKNIADPDQLETFLSDFQQNSSLPLIFAIDEEGGSVSRIANTPTFQVPQFSGAGAIGAAGNPEKAREMGSAIGQYLRQYGFHLDFAPVVDINSNPDNIIIGSRSFGSDAQTVSTMANAMIDGLHSAGIMACIKHFPGHGDTSGDSHDGYVSISKSWEELLQCELIPFINALDKTDLVMAAHISTPYITRDGLPASLSPTMLTDKLRGELGYDGVIITDSLAMGAITQNYSSAESSVLAFTAGADLLLMPYDYIAAYEGILSAVQNGEISMARLDERDRKSVV